MQAARLSLRKIHTNNSTFTKFGCVGETTLRPRRERVGDFSKESFKRIALDLSLMASNIDPQTNLLVTVVGSGRIGSALIEMSPYPTKLIRRGDPIETESGPIIVCTRNDALEAVIEATPRSRQKDLVFIQNGMILPYLEEKNLEECTQALIFFGITKLGDSPMDGITDLDPDGLTSVWGKHANIFCDILKAGGLTCKVLEKTDFLTAMLEKLIWISAVMLVGTEHGVNVGEVNSQHKEEVSALMLELGRVGGEELDVSVTSNMVERLSAYSKSVQHFPCAMKEFQWRNGWFYDLTRKALAEGKEDPCPMHTELLKKTGQI